MRRVFVDAGLPGDRPDTWTLDTETSHYLMRVLRLDRTEPLHLFDGTGLQCRVLMEGQDQGRAHVRALDWEVRGDLADQPIPICLLVALLKGSKLDSVMQKATELGVTNIRPVITRRTVARPEAGRTEARLARWRRISGEAARQCGRVSVPDISEPTSLENALSDLPDWTESARFMLWEEERARSLRQALAHPSAGAPGAAPGCALLVGPEGGFEAEEVQRAQEIGFLSVSLGPRTLRAETAPLAALACVQLLWGDMG